jgi:hypothetical protein
VTARTREVALVPRSVADFHNELFARLEELGLTDIRIHSRPNEVENPIPFAEDREHASYAPEYANRLVLEFLDTTYHAGADAAAWGIPDYEAPAEA